MKYTKEQARELIKNGTYQIENDCDKLEVLMFICNYDFKLVGSSSYYWNVNNGTYQSKTREIIKLSDIIEEKVLPIRFKPKPDYSKEIEVLQNKAKENGMKVELIWEKL